MIWIVVVLGLCTIALERVRPGWRLPKVPGWLPRVIAFNAAQLGIVFLGAWTWDTWFGGTSLFQLGHLGAITGGLIAYLTTTFIYYWWHRARHAVPLLWRLFHQLHHSPSRLEVLTAFYKHPLEMAANGVLSAAIVFLLLGVSVEAAAINTLLCGLAEYFYHVNMRTPRWVGFVIQRPEMHRIHHEKDAHRFNYGDLPVWDMLFGTYHNPATVDDVECGFEPELEGKVGAMLAFRDVHDPQASAGLGRKIGITLLLALGLVQMAGAALQTVAPQTGKAIAGLGRLTVASPNPKVFTRVGDQEPFAFRFEVEVQYVDGQRVRQPLDAQRYARIEGPYMYRNVYGAMLAFGDFLPATTVEAALRHGLCTRGHLAAALDRQAPIRSVTLYTQAHGVGAQPAPRTVRCEAA
jgi:sterol desaturase/sphingolipid hydroxylase (fatty acid hydroxylase superfamily)